MVYTFEVYFKGELIHEDDYAYNTVEEAEEKSDEIIMDFIKDLDYEGKEYEEDDFETNIIDVPEREEDL